MARQGEASLPKTNISICKFKAKDANFNENQTGIYMEMFFIVTNGKKLLGKKAGKRTKS